MATLGNGNILHTYTDRHPQQQQQETGEENTGIPCGTHSNAVNIRIIIIVVIIIAVVAVTALTSQC